MLYKSWRRFLGTVFYYYTAFIIIRKKTEPIFGCCCSGEYFNPFEKSSWNSWKQIISRFYYLPRTKAQTYSMWLKTIISISIGHICLILLCSSLKQSLTVTSTGSFFDPLFLIVDPLGEFGNSERFVEKCKELDIRVQPLWCRHTARNMNLESKEVCPARLRDQNECIQWLLDNSIPDKSHVLGVVSETDTGLRTSELFSSCLGLSTSNGELEARRDKFMMVEALRRNNLPHIQQCLTDNWGNKYFSSILYMTC